MLPSHELVREAFSLTSFRTEMSEGSNQTESPRGEWGRGGKQGRHLGGFFWEADNATVSQAMAQGHHLDSCNIFFILKTFMPPGMTSSKDRGEIKEKSILYSFPSLFFKQGTSVASASVLPYSSIAPSHLSPPEGFPFTWDSYSLPQGTGLLL